MTRLPRRHSWAATALVLAGAWILVAAGAVLAASHEIAIAEAGYEPNALTVIVGEPITWTNATDSDHTVTSDEGSELDSGPILPAEAYGHVFETPGTYIYHCDLHPDEMAGTIVVEAAPASSAPSGSSEPTPPAGTLPPNFSPFPSTGPLPTSPPPSATPSQEPSSDDGSLLAILPFIALTGAVAVVIFLFVRRRASD